MSRDPKDQNLQDKNGVPIDPKRLHKYLYAGGDPVNAKDPTGQDDLVETGNLDFEDENTTAKAAAEMGEEDRFAACFAALQGDLVWCSVYSRSELGYWACTQRAHLNFSRCLAGLETR